MDTIYLIIILAAVGLLSLVLYFIVKPSRTTRTTDSLYGEGLRLMLEGNFDEAAEKLKSVVKEDTGYVDAYLKLGDIFREKGQYKQALKVHQSLTVRRNLYPAQRLDIYHSLVEDYKALGQYDKALHTADKMLEIDRKNVKALRAKLDIFRALEQWDDAAEILQSVQKSTGEDDARALARYKVQEGRKLENKGDGKEARVQYRKALKLDPRCCAALYYLAESYDNEDRIDEAVDYWKQFGERCPEFLHLVTDKIEQRLFTLGDFHEIEQYYNSLLKKHPDSIEAAAGLASFYERKGEVKAAIQSLEEALEKEPRSLRAHILLAKNYNKEHQNDKVEKQLNAMLKEVSRQQADQMKQLSDL
ncbi:MAG TPA: tetratricopeptide repeat protein [bacterium]|nr:tetratricopeptide repeat protein [bacterium]